jgi:putative DNA methylase
MLSAKPGKKAYLKPLVEGSGYRFTVKIGDPDGLAGAKDGTKLSRANFKCIMTGDLIPGNYIKEEGKAGRMGARLLAIVAEGSRERVFLDPTSEQEALARSAKANWRPEALISGTT